MPPRLLPQSFFEASHHGKSLAFQLYMLCRPLFLLLFFYLPTSIDSGFGLQLFSLHATTYINRRFPKSTTWTESWMT